MKYILEKKIAGVNGQIFIDFGWKSWQSIASRAFVPCLHFQNFCETHCKCYFLCMQIPKYLYSNFAFMLPHYTLMKVYFLNYFIIWISKFIVKDAASALWCLILFFVNATVSFQAIASWSLMSPSSLKKNGLQISLHNLEPLCAQQVCIKYRIKAIIKPELLSPR